MRDLVADESCGDTYVRDLMRGTPTMASPRADGGDAANSDSAWPIVGPVGDQLALGSGASDLVAVDTDEVSACFLAVPPTGPPCTLDQACRGNGSGVVRR